MHTAYHPELTDSDSSIVLSQDESNHAVKVLRMQNGQKLKIANGKGIIALGTVADNHHKRCVVDVSEFQSEEPPQNLIHIAIAPTKSMDRMTWFVEKATELGIDKISLIKCANNERGIIKTEKLIKSALSAMKQSKRFFLPQIEELVSFKEFVQNHPEGYMAYCDPNFDQPKLKLNEMKKGLPVLIGPEGDFRKEEIELALSSGYSGIDLGKNILRTETAALHVTSSLALTL